jgi:predicted anti-sigma-YlaC factor YlaD
MTPHEEMLDNVAAYALGVLSPREAVAVEAHLRECRECRDEYAFLRPVVTAVARTAPVPDAVPSALLKQRLMRQMRRETGRPSALPWVASAVAAACLIVAVLLGIGDVALQQRVDRDRAALAQQRQIISDLTSPDVKRYAFHNGDVFSRQERLYLAMRNLRRLPSGKVYQAWTQAAGSKVMAPSVTFGAGRGGGALVALPEVPATVIAVAVSVEPAGGSQQPTTTPIAVVKLSH